MKSIVLFSALTFSACAAFAAPMQTTSTPPASSMPPATTTTSTTTSTNMPNMNNSMMKSTTTTNQQQQDGQIVQTLMVIDMNEINAAKEALKKSTNASVKKFAKDMESSHTRNLDQTKKLGVTPVSSDKSMALQKKGQMDLTQLMGATGKNFDVAYITAMVNGHQEVLAMIDSDLMRNTTNPKLLNQLKATRAVVAHHLEMAKDIQKNLMVNKT
jgi:putative membrane protein